MIGGWTTTPTGRTSRLDTSPRQRSLVGGGWRTRFESHKRWTDEGGPLSQRSKKCVCASAPSSTWHLASRPSVGSDRRGRHQKRRSGRLPVQHHARREPP